MEKLFYGPYLMLNNLSFNFNFDVILLNPDHECRNIIRKIILGSKTTKYKNSQGKN
jgi:hypothetical protein